MLVYVQILILRTVVNIWHALLFSVFVRAAGGVSFIWWIFWNVFVYNSPETHPRIDPVEKNYIMKTIGTVAYERVSFLYISSHQHVMFIRLIWQYTL